MPAASKVSAPCHGWEVPGSKRDKALDALAAELGFQTRNVMARVILNEISHCPKTAFFKAIGQFTRFTRRN